ncbi:MAG: hypothetical protein HOP25_04010 [Methylotenera sp.]|nr:hypothetical protein [Methylotenera sp.]
MIGLGVLLFLCIWGAVALLIASLIGKKLLKRFTKDAEGRTTSKGVLIILVLSILVFFAPIADEIISYPAYSKMCQDAGKYEFAPNMDEKKVFGREYHIDLEEKRVQIFPTYKELELHKVPHSGVVVDVSKRKIIDTNSKELLLVGTHIKAVRSFFAMPWDGSRIPWLLHECYPNEELIYNLQLKRTIS